MDRTASANTYFKGGYNCAQAVACAFSDVIGLPAEQVAGLLSGFGGGLRAGEICGAVSGAALALGAKWPYNDPADPAAKERVAEKMQTFHARFRERFGSLRCEELKPMEVDPAKSPAAQRLGAQRNCEVYVLAAVEILEEMMGE